MPQTSHFRPSSIDFESVMGSRDSSGDPRDTAQRHLHVLLERLGDESLVGRASHHSELGSQLHFTLQNGPGTVAPQVGAVIRNTWTLSRLLGAGAFGLVFYARHEALCRDDAIKFLHPHLAHDVDLRRRFAHEARVMAKLRGDHLVHVYDYGEHDGLPFFAMEYLLGRTLDQRLDAKRPVKLAEFHELANGILLALEEVHARGIVHRDIKPANIFVLDHTNHVKMLDFGLAMTSIRLTSKGTTMGTPLYMAPELLLSPDVAASIATDIYSVGVVLYQMLAGKVPVMPSNAAKTQDFIRQLACGTPLPLRAHRPDVSSLVEDLILRAIDKDPERRPKSARELADDLKKARVVEGKVRGAGMQRTGALAHPRDRNSGRKLIARVGLLFLTTAVPVIGMHPRLEESSDAKDSGYGPTRWMQAWQLSGYLSSMTLLPSAVSPIRSEAADSASTPREPVLDEPKGARSGNVSPRNDAKRFSTSQRLRHMSKCEVVRRGAAEASASWKWLEVVIYTDGAKCWSSERRREQKIALRVRALAELERFAECAKLGRNAKDDSVRDLSNVCQRMMSR